MLKSSVRPMTASAVLSESARHHNIDIPVTTGTGLGGLTSLGPDPNIVLRMDLIGPDTLCNATNLPNFVLMVNTFRCDASLSLSVSNLVLRIIVLTYNRPLSLLRLLRSLENSDYTFSHNNPGWRLVLELRVDAGGHEVGADIQE